MQPESKPSNSNKLITGIVILVVVVVLFVGVAALNKKSSMGSKSGNSATSTTNNASRYKDGTYNAEGSYNSPGGNESVSVQLTLKDNTVTAATVTPKVTTDDEAKEYQNAFISGYKQYVVGKSMNSISVSRVSGSSLTSQGFNDALATIKQQAKA